MALAHHDGSGIVFSPLFLHLDPRTQAVVADLPPPAPPFPVVYFAGPDDAPPGYRSHFVVPASLRRSPVALRRVYLEALRLDEHRTRSLVQLVVGEGLVPSREEESRRENVILSLKKIILVWVKYVARQRGLPMEAVAQANGTVLAYGSYGLGVHGSNSDIDALCVCPHFANMEEDFFVVLHDMIEKMPEVSDLYSIKSAKVPLMRFKFNGVSVDFTYAQLQALSVPEDVVIFDPYLVIDGKSWKSLSGFHANMCILQLVPKLANFRYMLRCIKFWARRRGIYSHLLGFFGGIHWAILVAFICQRHPNASLSSLICVFFETFSQWSWPCPVIMQDIPFMHPVGRSFMPIMMPCSPFDWCNSNITSTTFRRITEEFQLGYTIVKNISRPDFIWRRLFEPFPYASAYSHFIRVFVAASNGELGDWLCWVKSRFLGLILMIEEVLGYCDPNSSEYIDHNAAETNAVFYWGLLPVKTNVINLGPIKDQFMKSVNSTDYRGARGKLDIMVVDASWVPKSLQDD